MRRPSASEICVLSAWVFLCLTCAAIAVSSKLYLALLWALYGNRNWPLLTDLYVNSSSWIWVIPGLTGLLIFALWRRQFWKSVVVWVLIGLHFLSIAM